MNDSVKGRGTGHAEQNGNSGRQESVWSATYSLLASSKFGLFLLLIIGCVSFLGMFILQNAPPEEYVSKYGQFWGNFIKITGLRNAYSVWWYLLLILLLCLNLVLCSLNRIKPSIRQAFSKPAPDDNQLLREARSLSVQAGSVTVQKHLETSLKKRGFVLAGLDKGSVKLIAAQKGSVSRLGYLVTHVAVLLVLVAGLINGKTAYRVDKPLSIGDTLDVSRVEPSARFSIRVDDFVIETNELGRVRAYKSTLTLIENGKAVLTKVIGVNHPLLYKGIGFYQASYGEEPDRIREARLYLIENGASTAEIDVPFLEKKNVPGTDLQIRVARYVPHFVKNLETGEVRTRSLEPKLPAIKLEVLRGGTVVDSGWLIRGMEAHSSSGELGRFFFADYFPEFYTGIDVVKNPGATLLFTGFGVAGVGLLLSFLVVYKRVWVKIIEERPGQSEVRIAGTSARQPLALKQEIESMYEALERRRG